MTEPASNTNCGISDADRSYQVERLESIGRLAGGVAHDFNNLLTIISGYTDMLIEDDGLHEDAKSVLGEIRAAAERAGDLTRQLLAFSRRQSIQPEVIEINAGVLRVERLLRRLIGEHIDLTVALGEDTGYARLDPTQFEQVILNIAVNARDAMPSGGTLRVTTHHLDLSKRLVVEGVAVPSGPYVVIEIEDSGVGMDNEVLRHIFEPFFSTKKSKGTGLGLATVYGIVKQHGGFIFVSSERGRGTRFEILFPAVAHSEPTSDFQSAPAAALADGNGTVLLVEDEPGLRRLASQMLASQGYDVLEAGDGERALEILRSRKGDVAVVVSDVIMPRMGGPELASVARREWQDLPFVFMSGYVDESFGKSRALPAGTVFLPKPFTRDAILTTIRQVLDGVTLAA